MKSESFDLNLAVQRWRENLAQSPAFRSENLNELESHLRDSVATLQTRELSDEEVFLIASRRVGGDKQLEAEFGKVNGRDVWLDRVFWILLGVQVWNAVSTLARTLSFMSFLFGWKMTNYDYGLTLPVIFSTLMQLAGTAACLVFCWWLFTQKAEKLTAWLNPFLKRRMNLVLGGVVLCIASAIPHFIANLPLMMFRHDTYTMSKVIVPLTYSQAIFGPVAQLVAMVSLTLYLARERVRGRTV